MKLDKTKPYGEILGSMDGSRYVQNNVIFDANGDPLKEQQDAKRKPGRPPKEDK